MVQPQCSSSSRYARISPRQPSSRPGKNFQVEATLFLFPQISQVLLDCLDFEFQLAEIAFQSRDLFLFGLVATLEMTAAPAAFTTAVAIASALALTIAVFAITSFIV
jgi:hypothetical protein